MGCRKPVTVRRYYGRVKASFNVFRINTHISFFHNLLRTLVFIDEICGLPTHGDGYAITLQPFKALLSMLNII